MSSMEVSGPRGESLEPKTVEGWMHVLEFGASNNPKLLSNFGQSWSLKYCVLQIMGLKFSQFNDQKEADENRLRIANGSKIEQGSTLIIGSKGDPIVINTKVPSEKPVSRTSSRKEKKTARPSEDSGYERGSLLRDRRGSVPAVVQPTCDDPSDVLGSSNRFMSFISRTSSQIKHNLHLKRAKSATKLETKKPDGIVVNGDASGSGSGLTNSLKRTMSLSRLSRRWQGRLRPGHEKLDTSRDGGNDPVAGGSQSHIANNIRSSHSFESLFTLPPSSGGHPIDLSLPQVQIKPLHSSVFGQENCFQISTTNSTKFFSCRSPAERQKWMKHLQNTVQPFQEQNHRKDLSLELWIMEAKNLPPKHKYFCEIYLDSVLYAQTSSKANGSFLFWGEQFEMGNLPSFNALIIKLFKEGSRNKRKDVNILVGQVEVPIEKLTNRQLSDVKFPVVSRLAKDATLRLKAKYQSIEIQPLANYQLLIEYVQKEYRPLVSLLETSLVHVKEKEDMARALVYVMQKLGRAKEFLVDILIDEINRQDNPEILLRGNSVASKAIDVYMKLVAEKYLHDTLSDFIKMVLESPLSLEVDPKHLVNGADLRSHRENLLKFCQHVWFKIFNSHSSVPVELKLIFCEIKSLLLRRTNGNEDLVRQLISSCLFLRFLCPAILYPSMFGLTRVLPQDKDARNLTLIAKTIQGLANFTKFGSGKEDFMVCMNEFVQLEAANVKTFLDQISTVDMSSSIQTDECWYVDLGREVSILHSLLQESFKSMSTKAPEEHRERFGALTKILSDISASKSSLSSSGSHRASIDSLRSGCDSVCATPQSLLSPPPNQKHNDYDGLDGEPCSQASTPRFISNTSFMLTNSTNSMSSDAGNQFFNVPRSRNTMREMQDSDQYVSFTSEKALPVLPPMTSASVLFGANQSHDLPPPAGGNHLMYAAETTGGDDFSSDVLSMIDSMIISMSSANGPTPSGSLLWKKKGSSSSLSHQGTGATNTAGRQQPLAFSNPLFSYQSGKSSNASPVHTPQNQTPPVVASSECRPLNENGKKHVLANGSVEHSLSSLPSSLLTCSTSPSPSLGHPPIQRAGFLYGCHSHENLPHQKGSTAVPLRPSARNSAALSVSDVDSYFAAASGGALSRSMEFPAPAIGPDGPLKRNNTDSLIIVPRGPGVVGLDTPPESPTCCTTGHPMGRRNGQTSGTVRMGVRSMQRKLQESEKGKLEYEMELRVLRQQLTETRRKLEQEKMAAVTQTKMECCQRLRQTEEQFLQKLSERDSEIESLKERLLGSEQRNHQNESQVRDLQLQVKELMGLLSGQRSRVVMTHGQVLDGRQCSTH